MGLYKINEHKPKALVYTNNSTAEKEFISIVPFKFTKKNLKYLGTNLTKEVGELYDKNYKAFKNQ